jgi:glycosyltransferase involved in cell wall biosynthesis
MRVSLVTETYFPQVNGVSRTLGQLARVLSESGDKVQILHPDYGESPARENVHLVRSVRVPFYKELYLPLPPFGPALRAIDDFAPDIVHIATEATLGFTVLGHTSERQIPTVSSFHTNFDQYADHYQLGWSKGTIWRYLRWFHNSTRETFVPSHATIAELEQRGFERLVLWPRGVDGVLFRPDRPGRHEIRASLGYEPDDVVVAYVSRLAPEKNVEYLAEALSIVAAARPAARFLFVGDGPSRPALENTIGAHATFVGYRTGEDLADHYAAADLFAFSSLTETFGNVILEAMASGLPVIATRAGGVGETVRPGETGVLVEPSAPPSQFADAVISFIDDADNRRRTSASARAYALSQSWDEIMRRIRTHYQAAIGSTDGEQESSSRQADTVLKP